MSTYIADTEDVEIVNSKRVLIKDCIEVVILGSNEVSVEHCYLKRLRDSALPIPDFIEMGKKAHKYE